MPILVAPMSAMLMAHKEGEPATARAAVKANTSMVRCRHDVQPVLLPLCVSALQALQSMSRPLCHHVEQQVVIPCPAVRSRRSSHHAVPKAQRCYQHFL